MEASFWAYHSCMPYYEYQCVENGEIVEVRHGMSEQLTTWGELAARAAVDPGDTRTDAPIQRIMSSTVTLTGTSGQADFRGCGTGCACADQN